MSQAARTLAVTNTLGLHARPAMQFVDAANGFASAISVEKRGEDPMTVDGKSVMQMITLAAAKGTELTIRADGEDADAAVAELAGLFESNFGEE